MVDFWKRQALSQCEEQRLRAIGYSYQQITEEYKGIKRHYYEHIEKYRLKRDDISARYYQLENAIKTIDIINSGISPVDIDWFDILYNWQLIDDKLRCYYDLQTLYYIVNNVDITVDKLLIIDAVIAQLKARNQNVINADTCFEYLPHYREIIETSLRFVPTIQQQEQIYSISTNLTEKQLIALLGRLKDKEFVAPEQTEEDFLNAFNPNAAKQGTIKWIKRSGSRTDKPVCKTAIVDFIYRIICDNIKEVELIHNVEVIFGLTINKSTVSCVSRRNAKKASEYSEVLADIFAEIANL